MADEQNIAHRLLQVAANVSNQPTLEETNFSSLVQTTRSHFRREASTPNSRRGRKRCRTFKKKVFLMKLSNADFFPSKPELNFLKQRGLGEANASVEISRDQSWGEIKENMILLFDSHIQHLLRMCDFQIGKMQRNKRITRITSVESGGDLEAEMGQSKIIVLPLKDFPADLPIITNEIFNAPSPSHTRAASSNNLSLNRNSPSTGTNVTSQEQRRSTRMRPRRIQEIDDEESSTDDDVHSYGNEPVDGENHFVPFPSLPENAETVIIDISRANCFNELMNLYKDEEIINKQLNVRFIGEVGIDGGGLTKELLNIFFEKCWGTFFQGEDCCVPYLPLNKRDEQDKYIVIGRILQHMLILTSTVPMKLSRITLTLIGKPDAEIDAEMLLLELMNYVNPYLRKILKKGRINFSSLTEKEQEIVTDFFQTNKFFTNPNASNFSEQLKTIATELLIEMPRRFIDKLRQGVQPAKDSGFWASCDFNVFVEMQTPTPSKIVNCLVTDPHLTNEENEVLHYLMMYINCLDKDNLLKFIFLITASYQMPDAIHIKFNDASGLSQRPLFTTCTDTLTLPKTYSNYNELKNDLNICLHTDEAREYTSY